MTGLTILPQLRERHFFTLVLPVALVIESAFTSTLSWQAYPRGGWIPFFDLCIFLPALYLLFFSSGLEVKARLLRCSAVVGLGLLATRFMVPEANQILASELPFLRTLLIVIVVAFEGLVVVKVLGAIYRRNADAKSLEQDFAMPHWMAKLMILEARFWKAVWDLIKRK